MFRSIYLESEDFLAASSLIGLSCRFPSLHRPCSHTYKRDTLAIDFFLFEKLLIHKTACRQQYISMVCTRHEPRVQGLQIPVKQLKCQCVLSTAHVWEMSYQTEMVTRPRNVLRAIYGVWFYDLGPNFSH